MRMVFENRYGSLAARTPSHLYLLPHPVLRPFVAHYTICLPGPGYGSAPTLDLIPDASGCLVYTLQPDGELRGVMYGPTTKVVTVTNDLATHTFRFFVEFRPGGLRYFTPLPQHELADRTWDLAETGPALLSLARACFDRAGDLDEFVRLVDGRLAARAGSPGDFLPMLRRLSAARGAATVSELADYTGYSPRHLARLFREGTGLTAKAFSRVLRVNEAVRRLTDGPSLTRLAQDLGYYDQPHFIHDFQAVCGLSPSEYLQHLSHFYNEPLKF